MNGFVWMAFVVFSCMYKRNGMEKNQIFQKVHTYNISQTPNCKNRKIKKKLHVKVVIVNMFMEINDISKLLMMMMTIPKLRKLNEMIKARNTRREKSDDDRDHQQREDITIRHESIQGHEEICFSSV